jgi:hypothetical protein
MSVSPCCPLGSCWARRPIPAVERPAIAGAVISVNGRVVRACGVGATTGEAIARLIARLRIRLERA